LPDRNRYVFDGSPCNADADFVSPQCPISQAHAPTPVEFTEEMKSFVFFEVTTFEDGFQTCDTAKATIHRRLTGLTAFAYDSTDEIGVHSQPC
jgi:hypothetical protein